MALHDRLTKDLEKLQAQYEEHFAGQSRQTRDVALLERMLRGAREVMAQVDAIPEGARGRELGAVSDEARRVVEMYEGELRAIRQAKEAGPEFEPFSVLATRANLVFARYVRNFAGQSRSTRDALLLEELIDELVKVDAGMTELAGPTPKPAFAGDVELVRKNIKMYRAEAEAISTAQTTGTPEDRANLLATLANNAFALYRAHFAGAPRTTRRPALLVRIIDNLEIFEDRMQRLTDGGLDAEFNRKNTEIVRSQLEMYRTELTEIRTARRQTKMEDLMGMLGGAANELFEEYRTGYAGKDRSKVDRDKLGVICDKLHEILRQMEDLSTAESSEMNEGNQKIVRDQVTHFEHEFEQITAAQAKN